MAKKGKGKGKGKHKKDAGEDAKGEPSEKKKHVSLKSETEMETEEEEEPPMAIVGIVRLYLPVEVQTELECVIGEQCTLDSPWVEVKKSAILENIATMKELSPFYDSRVPISTYPAEMMFVGWDVLEEAENQFLVCLTIEARIEILEVLEQKRIAVEERLANAVLKSVKEWKSLGSETFIEEAAIRDTRAKVKTEMLTERQIEEPAEPEEFEDEGGNGEDDFSFRFFPKEDLKAQRIARRRYDNCCQVSPPVTDREAQTYTAIPRQTWSQYEYAVDIGKGALGEDVMPKLEGYLTSVVENVESQLTYNAVLDLYCDDYGRIGVGARDYEVREKVVFEEYESFIDVQHCKERVVTSVAWHPMLTGTAAVSYAENTRFTYFGRSENKGLEQMNKVVKNRFYGNNLVLLWSFTDKFTPKLRLECPDEVHSLAFCPMDGDLLVGGLACGQIVVWDLAGRLERVEQREALSEKQLVHRNAMMAHLSFMRPLAPPNEVPPAFVSSIEFSHDACVTHIQWICPRWTVSNRGKLGCLDEDDPPSLALLTGCEDGTVALWDLEARQPTVESALVQPRSRGRKARMRPAALDAGAPRFRPLHLVLRPQFSVVNQAPDDSSPTPVSSMAFDPPFVRYKLQATADFEPSVALAAGCGVAKDAARRDRYAAKCWLPEDEAGEPRQRLGLATATGAVVRLSWDGIETRSGAPVDSQTGTCLWHATLHDGPVSCIARNPFCSELVASAGGHVWALWSDTYEPGGQPLVWRYNAAPVSWCAWSEHRPSLLLVSLADGTLQAWHLVDSTSSPALAQSISGRVINAVCPHHLPLARDVVAVADYNGSLRIFILPPGFASDITPTHVERECIKLREFVKREQNRRQAQREWVTEWQEEFAAAQAAVEAAARAQREEEERRAIEAAQEEMQLPRRVDRHKWLDMEYQRLLKAKRHARFAVGDTEVEQRGADRFRRRYLSRVGGGAAREGGGLSEAQRPLQQLREEERLKRQRLKARQRDRSNILANTLALAFPDMVRAETQVEEAVSEEVQSERQIEELGKLFIEDYKDCEEDALNLITEHGFDYEFDWLRFLAEGEVRHRIFQGEIVAEADADDLMFSEMDLHMDKRRIRDQAMEMIEEQLNEEENEEPEEHEGPEVHEGPVEHEGPDLPKEEGQPENEKTEDKEMTENG